MILEKGDRIYSEDYADLIYFFTQDISKLDRFADPTIQMVYPNIAFSRVPLAIVRISVNQIDNNTISQLGYQSIPTLSGLISQRALDSSGITTIRRIPFFNLRGKGVLIGIVDTGIDYTNPIFRYADGTTRIAALWDQTIIGEEYRSNTYYGTEYSREQINQALQSANPFDVVPSRDESGHGTMLAGIAAGNDIPDSGFSGVAPDTEFVIVKLKPAKQYLKEFWRVPSNAICYQDNDIIFALEYMELTANKIGQPISICVALGNSLGAHDNSSIPNLLLSARAEVLNLVISTAAGNEGIARRHYYGKIDPKIGWDLVELKVAENEKGFTMQLWGDSPGLFAIDIKTPSGEYTSRILPRTNEHYDISFIFEITKIQIDYQVVETQNGDQLILLRFTDPAPGIWSFRVFGKGDLSLSFHIWLPIGAFISEDTYFVRSDPYTTIVSFGNAIEPITVTAYNPEDDTLYIEASKGYTREGVIKPDIAAPGVNITSPSLDQGFVEVSGTSASVAYTAGAVALILEWGIVRGNLPFMSTIDVKNLITRGARRDENLKYPNREWGYGILDVYNIFDSLRRENN